MQQNQPQTLTSQLFEGFNKALWALILLFIIVGLVGTFYDLADAHILGTNQGLDAGSAATMLITGVVLSVLFVAYTYFSNEQRTKRQVAPTSPALTKGLVTALCVAGAVLVILFLYASFSH